MDFVLVIAVVVGSSGAALLAARGALSAVLHVMAHPPQRVSLSWRRVAFVALVFWSWYMAPLVAEKLPLDGMRHLLGN